MAAPREDDAMRPVASAASDAPIDMPARAAVPRQTTEATEVAKKRTASSDAGGPGLPVHAPEVIQPVPGFGERRAGDADRADGEECARRAAAMLTAALTRQDEGRLADAEALVRLAISALTPSSYIASVDAGLKRKREHDAETSPTPDDGGRPQLGRAHATLARLLQAQHADAAQVRDAYATAIALLPDVPALRLELALLLVSPGPVYDVPLAVTHLSRAVQLDPLHAKVHWALGHAHGLLGHHGAAEAEYNRAIALNPTYIDAHWRLAQLLDVQMQAPARAKAAYLQVVSLDPRHFMAFSNLGTLTEIALQQPGSALAYFKASLSINPNQARVHIRVAALYEKLNTFDAARQHYAAAVQVEPADHKVHLMFALFLEKHAKTMDDLVAAKQQLAQACELQRGDHAMLIRLAHLCQHKLHDAETASHYYEEALRAAPDAQSRRRCEMVLTDMYAALNRADKLTALLKTLTEVDPADTGAHAKYAQRLYDGGSDVLAARHFKAAMKLALDEPLTPERIKLIPTHSLCLLDPFVSCCMRSGTGWDEAEAALEFMTLDDPRKAEWHFRRAVVADDYRHNFAAAEAGYLAVLKLSPKHSVVCYQRLALARRRLGKAQESYSCLQQAMHHFPDDPEILLQLGIVLGETAEFQLQATKLLEKVLQVTRDMHAGAHFHLGVLLEARRRNPEALMHYQMCLLLDPANIDARLYAACILTNDERHEEAAHHFQSVIKIDPHNVAANFLCGKLMQFKLKRFGEARVCYERVLERNKELPEARSVDRRLDCSRLQVVLKLAYLLQDHLSEPATALQLLLQLPKDCKQLDHTYFRRLQTLTLVC